MNESENSNNVQKITYIVKEKLCLCHTSGIMNPLIRARSPVIVVTKLSHFLQKSFTMMMTMKTTFKCPFLE